MRTRKKREAVLSYDQRVQIVSAIQYVDRVVAETDLDKIAAYKKYGFDVMFAGDDHEQEPVYVEASAILKNKYGVDTIYVKRNSVSSTNIRKRIAALSEVEIK